jgi:protoheme IX farnesyltransferase
MSEYNPAKPAFWKDMADLLKLRVAVLAGAGALLGFAACDRSPGRAALAGIGVLLLAAGSGALNNYQDRFFDALSGRTRARPLPAGRFPPTAVPVLALVLAAAGSAVLFFAGRGPAAPLAGLAAMALYNGAYTPLKKKSLFALIPGILSGSLPPLVGWLAGGACCRPRAIYLVALFAVWQLPHLGLLSLAAAPENGPAPSFLDIFSQPQLRRLTAAWVAGFSLLTLYLKFFGLINGGPASFFAAANALILPAVFTPALLGRGSAAPRKLSGCFSASFLLLVLAAAADSLA